MKIAVLGGSGFVGSAVLRAIEGTAVPAPRLSTDAREVDALLLEAAAHTLDLTGYDVVVNAAGDPDASSTDLDRLVGANALLPVVALRAAEKAGVRRFV